MPRATSWSDLKIGLIALLSGLALAAGVLTFARIGALHGATTTIYMVSDEASGVMQGTEVWLAGRRVGLVQGVQLRPVSTDTSERVLIRMEILSQYMVAVRKNSNVRIRPGTSLIAEPVVAITAGTTNTPPVQAGDTLRALSQLAKSSTPVDIASLGDSAVAVATVMQRVASEAQVTATGPISALRRRVERQASTVKQAIHQFSARSSPQWQGTAARASRDTMLHAAVARVMAQTDSIRVLMTSDRTSFGRFRRDSTLGPEARHLLASTDQLRTQLSGSLDPRARGDSTLAQQLDRVHQQLDSLIADARRHPLKYVAF
ncbi:MAG TPA: MlaD family protein [Gemmatimonadaceae bacterium]|jgi:phospholipid/cholesterol/gamma-HCH transport system substrate-binding protein|nr:MlaD family protein [Gemmatimonadaceae bacterium]